MSGHLLFLPSFSCRFKSRVKDEPTAANLFEGTARKFPEKDALIFEDKRWTFRQLDEGEFLIFSSRFERQLKNFFLLEANQVVRNLIFLNSSCEETKEMSKRDFFFLKFW